MADVPLFAKELQCLHTDGSIAYHIYRQWGRHIAFVSGKTSWHDLTNFVSSTGMELHLTGEMDTDLNHMALACGVDKQQLVTTFSDQDAFARTVRSALGKYVYVRYRYADQKFTILFFN
jgi:hypothetical protein